MTTNDSDDAAPVEPEPQIKTETYTGPERRKKSRLIEFDLDVLRAALKREIEGEKE